MPLAISTDQAIPSPQGTVSSAHHVYLNNIAVTPSLRYDHPLVKDEAPAYRRWWLASFLCT